MKLITLGIVTVFAVALFFSIGSSFSQSQQDLSDELDEFALSQLEKIQLRSIRDNVEYCGFIGYDSSGELTATRAKRGQMDSCEPDDPPPGFDALASYHSPGAYTPDADTEVPSVDDLLADFDEDIGGYVSTPAGRVCFNDVEIRNTAKMEPINSPVSTTIHEYLNCLSLTD